MSSSRLKELVHFGANVDALVPPGRRQVPAREAARPLRPRSPSPAVAETATAPDPLRHRRLARRARRRLRLRAARGRSPAAVARLGRARRAPARRCSSAHDTRFLADRAAEQAARGDRRPRAWRCSARRGPSPTPVACRAVRRRRAPAGSRRHGEPQPARVPRRQGAGGLGAAGDARRSPGASSARRRARLAQGLAAAPRAARRARGRRPRRPVPSESSRGCSTAGALRARATARRLRRLARRRAPASSTARSARCGARVTLRRAATPIRASAAARPTRRRERLARPRPRRARRRGAPPRARDRRRRRPLRGASTPTAACSSESEALALLVDHLARDAAACAAPRALARDRLAGRARRREPRARASSATPSGSRRSRRRSPRGARRSPARRAAASPGRRFARDKDGILAGRAARGARRDLAASRSARRCARLARRHGRSACGRARAPRLEPRSRARPRAPRRGAAGARRRRPRSRAADASRRPAPRARRRRLPVVARLGHRAGAAALRRGARPPRAPRAPRAPARRSSRGPDASRCGWRRAANPGTFASSQRFPEVRWTSRRVLLAVSGRHRGLQGARAGARPAARRARACAAS